MYNFRLRINNTLVKEEPDGWEQLTETFRVDRDSGARSLTIDSALKLYSDGYDLLRDLWDSGSLGQEVTVSAEEQQTLGNWVEVYRGIIKLPALKWRHNPDSVELRIEDDSYYSKIKNNQGIKVKLDLPKSKNEVAITPVTWLTRAGFTPSTGTYDQTFKSARAIDVLRFLVEWMTDKAVGVKSDLLDIGGELESLDFTVGLFFRSPTATDIPSISFRDFWSGLSKERDIAFTIETGTDGRPTLRVEDAAYFYPTTQGITVPDAKEVNETVDTDRLYAKVRVGSSTVADEVYLQFPEGIRFLGFKEEEYTLLGQGNLDAELDITTSFVKSSNVIEEALVNGVDTYDEDYIWVQVDQGGNAAIRANWLLTAPPYYYNRDLTNQKTLDSFIGSLPETVAADLGDNGDGFLAYQDNPAEFIAEQEIYAPGDTNSQFLSAVYQVRFANDYSGPGYDADGVANNYGNGTAQGSPVSRANSRYTAPANGAYNFEDRIMVRVMANQSNYYEGQGRNVLQVTVKARIEYYDSSNTIIDFVEAQEFITRTDSGGTYPDCGPIDEYLFFNQTDNSRALVATDYAVVKLQVRTDTARGNKDGVSNTQLSDTVVEQIGDIDSITGSVRTYFKCTSNIGGGIYKTVNSRDYRAVRLEFNHPMTAKQWEDFKADTSSIITVVSGNKVFSGYADQITYKRFQNTAGFQLITSKNQSLQ